MTARQPRAGGADIRGERYRAMIDRYVSLRQAGSTEAEAITIMGGLTKSAREKFETAYRAETFGGGHRDSSCPRFAYDAAHVAKVLCANVGGFPTMRKLGRIPVAVGADGRVWKEDRAA